MVGPSFNIWEGRGGWVLKISNPEDTVRERLLESWPASRDAQTPDVHQIQNPEAELSWSWRSFSVFHFMGLFQDLGEAQATCSHSFPKASIPKLYKPVKPGPSPARRPVMWSHYYDRWRTLTSTHSNQMGKAQWQAAGGCTLHGLIAWYILIHLYLIKKK